MVKVSHEVPISLLDKSRKFNDYDYALVHLFEKYPKYYKFFEKSLSLGREVILDNSIFELGESFDHDLFAHWVMKLKPTYYILPDALEDCKKTLTNAISFLKKYPSLPGEPIGVVQGKTMDEIIDCYQFWDKEIGVNIISISFDYSVYKDFFPSQNKFQSFMLGRRHLIGCLESAGVLNKKKKHHLLGCSLPQEFSFYKDKEYIYSLDTSNPIVHGIKGIRYRNFGLDSKESIKLADLIDHKVNDDQLDDIMFNVANFKKLLTSDGEE